MVKIRYNVGEDIIQISVLDPSGAKLETYRCNKSDSKEYGRILKILYEKYDAKPELDKGFLEVEEGFFKF